MTLKELIETNRIPSLDEVYAMAKELGIETINGLDRQSVDPRDQPQRWFDVKAKIIMSAFAAEYGLNAEF